MSRDEGPRTALFGRTRGREVDGPMLPAGAVTPRNPRGEPTGHYTGRCGGCGSKDLWDDNGAYGCNDCGKFWCGFAG